LVLAAQLAAYPAVVTNLINAMRCSW